MNNVESGISAKENLPKWNGVDLVIPLEYVIEEQKKLMKGMVPEEIKPYVVESDGINIGIEDGLFMRWHGKYSKLFRDYCNNLNPDDKEENELILRIIASQLTPDDYLNLQKYFEASEDKEQGIGGIFFTEEEAVEFLKPFRH